LIDPIENALALDWRIGERQAELTEVRDDWRTVKAIGKNNRTAASQAALTSIRLTDEAVDALLWRRLDANAYWLSARTFPDFATFPADAQLGILSVAWAVGCDFMHTKPPRPLLIDAIRAHDWSAAKVHARLSEAGNPGVADRNRQQERCFDNAAIVAAHGLDPSILHRPASVIAPVEITMDPNS